MSINIAQYIFIYESTDSHELVLSLNKTQINPCLNYKYVFSSTKIEGGK